MKKFLVFLLIVAALLVVGDFLAKNAGETAAARQLKDRLQLKDEPEVSIDGFPFLLNVLRGTFPEVNVSAGEVTRSGLTLEDVELTLHDLRFELKDAISGDAGSTSAKSADGSAIVSENEINEVLGAEGAPFTITLDDGRASAELPQGAVTASVGVADGNLVLDPEGEIPAVSVPLPELFEEVEEVTATTRVAEVQLDFKLGRLSFDKLRSGAP